MSGGESTAASDDFAATRQHLRLNYAGFPDKVVGREAELAAATERARTAWRSANAPERGTEVLRDYLSFFRDRHLDVKSKERQSAILSMLAGPAMDPTITVLREGVLLLRIPSFGVDRRGELDRIIEENHERLVSSRILIIDLRGNGGGSDDTYTGLIRYLYTNPIRLIGSDFLASAGNAAYVRGLADSNLPETVRAYLVEFAERMKRQVGEFVVASPDSEIVQESVLPHPAKIGVLMDGRCASASEQFLLMARQSRKVTLIGMNSKGCLDYSNVRPIDLPSGTRVLGIPISRSRRLPAEPVDRDGIAPDVRVPDETDDWIAFALDRLDRVGAS